MVLKERPRVPAGTGLLYSPPIVVSTLPASIPAGPPPGQPPDQPPGRIGRRAVLAAGAAAPLGACVAMPAPYGPARRPPALEDGAFVMPDGARLPFRLWHGAGPPVAAILALHGMNDSRDAWDIPATDLAADGYAVYAPDQRGFGAAPGRGLWPGTEALVRDAAAAAELVRARHPDVPLLLMGESMGGAVLMCLAASALAPRGARYVLLAPAVWGRATMNVVLRSALWLVAGTVPGLALAGAPGVRVQASDNIEALRALSRNPLTIHRTRMDAVRGLVDLMDAALDAAPAFRAPGLFLYGAKDELVPKGAMATMWRRLPPVPGGARLAYYPAGYHLLLRDLGRAAPLRDIDAWVRRPAAPLPSGADEAAAAWLARRAADD